MVFSEWLGLPAGAVVSGSEVQFVMPEEAVSGISAVFMENPFLGEGSSQTFLGIVEPHGTTAESSSSNGFLQVTLTSRTGAFSGALWMDGVRQRLSGQILGNGSVWFRVARNLQSQVELGGRVLTAQLVAGNLEVSVAGEAGESMGMIQPLGFSNVQPVPEWLRFRRAGARGRPRSQGYFTVALPALPVADAGMTATLGENQYPQGSGYLTLTVAANGRVRVAGVLADGTAVAAATGIVGTDFETPLYVALLTPGAIRREFGGALLGRLRLAEKAWDHVSALDGGLKWFRPTVEPLVAPARASRIAATRLYSEGWLGGLRVGAYGAAYDNTLTLETGLNLEAASAGVGNAAFEAMAGKLLKPVVKSNINVTGNAVRTIPVRDPSYRVKINRSTGLWTVSFDPEAWQDGLGKGRTQALARGVIVQGGSAASGEGFFLSNAVDDERPESGAARIREP
jgi:hypothetical protein